MPNSLSTVCRLTTTCLLVGLLLPFSWDTPAETNSAMGQSVAPQSGNPISWQAERMVRGSHDDYPWMAVDEAGQTWVAYLAHDGEADRLRLARIAPEEERVEPVATIAGPGMLHRPRLVSEPNGTLWAVYAERTLLERWALRARRIEDGEPAGAPVDLGWPGMNHVFPDLTRASDGAIWVSWQALGRGGGSIYARRYDPGSEEWSRRIPVSTREEHGSSWRPRIAPGTDGAVRVLYERATRGEFDLTLATVEPGGGVAHRPVAETPSYEAFGEIAAGPDRREMVLTWEEGKENWGRDSRSHDYNVGINSGKRIRVVRLELESGELEHLPPIEPPIARMLGGVEEAWHLAVNQPQVAVDGTGTPWVFVRWAYSPQEVHDWQIAALRYSAEKGRWSEPVPLEPSSFYQDRLISVVRTEDGGLQMAWPADTLDWTSGRDIGVHVAGLDPGAELSYPADLPDVPEPPEHLRTAARSETPERPRSERYQARHEGIDYRLYWGDTHRHTDLSPDRTIWDGTLTEHFRYAHEVAELDFLGTSDHTDIGPSYYTPYKWWQSQKITDYLSAPGYFLGLYGYEREQSHPWGHRNVMFSRIGGPIVYIQRETYEQSEWSEAYPLSGRSEEIRPQELWQVLREANIPVAVISHTPANQRMGTDWRRYDHIDGRVENTVEIYQGARISYEALEAPQPTVGIDTHVHPDSFSTDPNAWAGEGFQEIGMNRWGTYQQALREGHELGVVASSDHISTHTSYAGVFADRFTRKGLLEGLQARRSIAATDEIVLYYTCNGRQLGQVFRTKEKPTLRIEVRATGPIDRLTVIRNETRYEVYRPEPGTTEMEVTFTDENPREGENRYYLRLVQEDGNMAWASPVWVTYEP